MDKNGRKNHGRRKNKRRKDRVTFQQTWTCVLRSDDDKTDPHGVMGHSENVMGRFIRQSNWRRVALELHFTIELKYKLMR